MSWVKEEETNESDEDPDEDEKSKNDEHLMCAMMVDDMVGIVDWRNNRTRKRFLTKKFNRLKGLIL